MSEKEYIVTLEAGVDYDAFNAEMIANTGGDLLRQYILEPEKHDEIIDILSKLIDYSNDTFSVIRKRYNSAVPRKLFV